MRRRTVTMCRSWTRCAARLLIASPVLVDPNFHRTVILIAEHTDEGAMGLVLNRPGRDARGRGGPGPVRARRDGAPVYVGGPVAADSVIVLAEFDEPSLAGVLIDDDLGFVGSGGDDLGEVAGGVRRARVFAGHAGWGPGPARGRARGGVVDRRAAAREEIFSEDAEQLWAAVLRRKGREYALLSTMPPDPSVN